MMITKFTVVFSAMLAILGACSTDRASNGPPAVTRDALPPHKTGIEQQGSSDTQLGSIDFANFTFPWPPDLAGSKRPLALRGGHFEPTRDARGMIDEMGAKLENIVSGDVTRDGTQEAIVVLSFITGGSAIPHAVYVYSFAHDNPKLIWIHSTGDRADGGLRRVYAENGELVIEQYSPEGSKGDCCPIFYVRTRYEWKGGQFKRKGAKQTLPNPGEHGSSIMRR